MRDSLQKLGHGAAIHEEGDEGLRRYVTSRGIVQPMETGYANATSAMASDSMSGGKEGADF